MPISLDEVLAEVRDCLAAGANDLLDEAGSAADARRPLTSVIGARPLCRSEDEATAGAPRPQHTQGLANRAGTVSPVG